MPINFLANTADIISHDGGNQARFKLVNTSDSHVNVYWIDRTGAEIQYASLDKGGAFTQLSTSSTHAWLVKSDDGKIAFRFYATSYGEIGVNNGAPTFHEFSQHSFATSQGQFDSYMGYGLIDVAKSLGVPDIGYSLSMRGQSNNIELNAINAPSAWKAGYTGKGITVAVIDAGVASHSEITLSNNGHDFVDGDSDGSPDNGAYREHALAVAANIAGHLDGGKNGQDVTGVAPDATIMNVRVGTSSGSNEDSMALGIRWAVDHGAKVICMPLQNTADSVSPSVLQAVQYAFDHNVVTVLVGGNFSIYGASGPALMAKMGIAIAVGNEDITSGQPFASSNLPGDTAFPWVMAPSTGYSPTSDGGYAYHHDGGTSYAGPYVAGLAALLVQKYPDATAKMIIDKIISGAATPAAVATDGNDTIFRSSANVVIDGGKGIDTLVYAGKLADYTVSVSGDHFTISGKANPGTIDTLLNVERVKFADGSIALDWNGHAGEVFGLYQAAFDRAPDPVGMGFWLKAHDDGATMKGMAQMFLSSPESITAFPDKSDVGFITSLYDNVFHRAPDAGGLAFHLNNLTSHAVDRADLLVGFTLSPENMAQLVGVMQHGMDFIPSA